MSVSAACLATHFAEADFVRHAHEHPKTQKDRHIGAPCTRVCVTHTMPKPTGLEARQGYRPPSVLCSAPPHMNTHAPVVQRCHWPSWSRRGRRRVSWPTGTCRLCPWPEQPCIHTFRTPSTPYRVDSLSGLPSVHASSLRCVCVRRCLCVCSRTWLL